MPKILAKMSTTVVQSNVPKLEGKQNYKTWNIRICSLLESKDELAAIEYIPRLKKAGSAKDQKDTTKAALAIAEELRKAGIQSPDQQTATTGIVKTDPAAIPLPTDPEDDDDDDEDEKSADPWRYHKHNKGAAFTIISSLADHVLTKVQGIKSAKLIYDRLKKLYRTATDLEEFMLLEKLFNVFYASAENMHKFIGQMNDTIKSLERLGISIDPRIIKPLILTRLGSHFQEFQSRKRETDLKTLSLDELFSQMMREDEVQ